MLYEFLTLKKPSYVNHYLAYLERIKRERVNGELFFWSKIESFILKLNTDSYLILSEIIIILL